MKQINYWSNVFVKFIYLFRNKASVYLFIINNTITHILYLRQVQNKNHYPQISQH